VTLKNKFKRLIISEPYLKPAPYSDPEKQVQKVNNNLFFRVIVRSKFQIWFRDY
jgi:hypothetical protein